MEIEVSFEVKMKKHQKEVNEWMKKAHPESFYYGSKPKRLCVTPDDCSGPDDVYDDAKKIIALFPTEDFVMKGHCRFCSSGEKIGFRYEYQNGQLTYACTPIYVEIEDFNYIGDYEEFVDSYPFFGSLDKQTVQELIDSGVEEAYVIGETTISSDPPVCGMPEILK
jgi:hypothetical protein